MIIAVKEVKESWKTPAVMSSVAIIIFVFFGLIGKPEEVSFQLSSSKEIIQLEPLVIASNLLGTIIGVLLLVISAVSALLVYRNKKV